MTQRSKPKSTGARRASMRQRRHLRIRRRLAGTAERPRLAVHRSLKHVSGQIIDDSRAVTLIGVTSSDPALTAEAPATAASSVEGEAAVEAPQGPKKKKGAPREATPAPEGAKTARARAAGRALAARALAKGIRRVVFDRGGYIYHGRIRAFAEGAREGGLEF